MESLVFVSFTSAAVSDGRLAVQAAVEVYLSLFNARNTVCYDTPVSSLLACRSEQAVRYATTWLEIRQRSMLLAETTFWRAVDDTQAPDSRMSKTALDVIGFYLFLPWKECGWVCTCSQFCIGDSALLTFCSCAVHESENGTKTVALLLFCLSL